MPPGAERPARRPGEGGRPSRAAPVALFVLLAGAIAAAGTLSYTASASDLRRQRERELASIAALKVDEIERWREERLVDADAIAADPTLLAALVAHPARAAVAGREVDTWFEVLRGVGEYAALAVVDGGGEVRFSAGDVEVDPREHELGALVRRALAERRAVMSDPDRHSAEDPVHLLVASPVTAGSGTPFAAVVLRVDPRRWLFRTVQSWPVPSRSGETLLVCPAGEHAAILNEPRLRREAGFRRALPLSRRDDPAVRAALGHEGVLDGIDDRGMRVLGAAEGVPGSPWRLLVKMDADEALAPLASLRLWLAAGVLALVLAAGAGAAIWRRSQQAGIERLRLRDEAERLSLARRLEHLTKYASDLVFLADEGDRLLDANETALRALGFSREELLGRHVRELRDPGARADHERRVAEAEAGGTTFETLFRRKDGSTFPVEVSAHAEVIEGRRYLHAVARDISERKAAEEALRASEAKFRAAFEFASLGIALVAPGGRLTETNRALRRMLGHGEEGLLALTFEGVHAPEDRGSAATLLRQMTGGAVSAVELPRRLLRRDGTLADVLLRATALPDRGGLRFALLVVEDVGEKKRLEAQLMLADRMASVGTLAAGVAHEINNPLAFILANLEFALAELREVAVDPEVPRALAEARDGGLRVREIVRDLKAFSRADGGGREVVDLRLVLQSALGVSQNEIRHRARLELDVGDVPPVLGSEHRLGQVLLNLLINAGQSIPEGHAAENVVRATLSTAPDGRARVEISDTGAGIPPEVLPRIFDPFFTTKPVGVGTGLGLSICHGIVSGLGGEIAVESTPGKGSTFRVLLPRAPASALVSPAPAARAPAAPRARVLVIDDEPLVGRAITRVLAPNHDVVAVTSGREALDALAGAPGRFDAVLCDLMMPDMTGMELHARLSEIAPALAAQVVFLTGGAFTQAAREFLERVPNPRLDKPFEPDQLRALVDRVLAPGAGRARAS